MNLETLKEIITNRLNAIRIQIAIASNEGRLEDYTRLAEEEKETLLILDKLNS